MSDYIRSTRECAFGGLSPVLAAAIRSHMEKHALGNLEAAALSCFETTSTKQKKGLFGSKTEVILTGMLLTPQWLVWAAGKDNEVPGVLSARLRDVQISDYEKSDSYKLIQDCGLDISGLHRDGPELASSFIGLGPEPAAAKFRTMLREAQAKA